MTTILVVAVIYVALWVAVSKAYGVSVPWWAPMPAYVTNVIGAFSYPPWIPSWRSAARESHSFVWMVTGVWALLTSPIAWMLWPESRVYIGLCWSMMPIGCLVVKQMNDHRHSVAYDVFAIACFFLAMYTLTFLTENTLPVLTQPLWWKFAVAGSYAFLLSLVFKPELARLWLRIQLSILLGWYVPEFFKRGLR